LVAFIHIYATGYFFAEVIFRYNYNKEREQHMLTHNFTIHGFEARLNVTNIAINGEINQGHHHIINQTLYTFGVLTDEQIHNMINAVSVAGIRIEDFLKNCIHHQLTEIYILNPDPPAIPLTVLNKLPEIPRGAPAEKHIRVENHEKKKTGY
jgi:hypothetical protein